MVLSAQMGKAGPPMDGKDLHIGDFGWGVLPGHAPLSISTLTVAGMAMGFALARARSASRSRSSARAARSLGEWHEAINLCAARRLPAVFCVQNNQTALSTPVAEQSAVRVLRRQGGGLRHPRLHDRRHRPRGDRGRLRLGRRARPGRRRSDADRDRRHAHVRPRPPRRHALPRQGTTVAGTIPADAPRATPTARPTPTGQSAIRFDATPHA